MKLVQKEKMRIEHPEYLPVIENYYYLAEYMEGILTHEKFISSVIKSTKAMKKNTYRSGRMLEMIDEMASFLPDEMKMIKNEFITTDN